MRQLYMVVGALLLVAACSPAQDRQVAQVPNAARVSCTPFDVLDSSVSPGGTLLATAQTTNGGLKRFEVRQRKSGRLILAITEDISNVRWLPNEEGLVYAVSPVHGTPGIYRLDARMGTTARLLASRNTSDPGYPDGADLFVLCSVVVADSGRSAIQYIWFPHIDSVDLRARPLSGNALRFVF